MKFSKNVSIPTLYHCKFFCSSIPYQLLLELDVAPARAEIVTLSEEEVKNAEHFVNISPRRVAPVLVIPSGEIIIESGAISLYLLETFDPEGKLYPLPGLPDRPRFLQAVFFVVSEMYHATAKLFIHCLVHPKETRDRKEVDALIEKFDKVVIDHLERELDGGRRKYYLGQFSAADVFFSYITRLVGFVRGVGDLLAKSSVVTDYANRLAERKSYKELYIRVPKYSLCFKNIDTIRFSAVPKILTQL